MRKTLVAVASSLSLLSCGTCIARGSLVSTPLGRRRVEELGLQDAVWCIDPLTGERVSSVITDVRRAKREVMRLEGEGFSLRCTTDHPLYDPESNTWAPAGDWVLGQRRLLLLVDDTRAPRVVQVERRLGADGVDEVFDLTVEHELHNFVADGVLVHNKKPIQVPCPLPDGGTVREYDGCDLPDGGPGQVRCGGSMTTCTPLP